MVERGPNCVGVAEASCGVVPVFEKAVVSGTVPCGSPEATNKGHGSLFSKSLLNPYSPRVTCVLSKSRACALRLLISKRYARYASPRSVGISTPNTLKNNVFRVGFL